MKYYVYKTTASNHNILRVYDTLYEAETACEQSIGVTCYIFKGDPMKLYKRKTKKYECNG